MLQFIRYVGMRFLLAIITLFLVTFVVFSLMELNPNARYTRCAEYMPLGKPYFVRWVIWLKGAFLHGDFGRSCVTGMQISTLLGTKFWISLGLCLSSLLLAYLIAIPVGIYSVAANRPALNGILRFFSYLGLAIPNFLFALIIILVWAAYFGNTPSGLISREYHDVAWSYDKFVNFISHAWIPVIVLGWSATAIALQTVRALMSDEYRKPYVTAAQGRGVSGRRLLWQYPARHAFGPILNSLGFDLNRIFNELPLVALILTLTEAGELLIQSLIRSHDQQLAAAILFLLTASIIGLNFITDIILAILDPRFRRGLLGSF